MLSKAVWEVIVCCDSPPWTKIQSASNLAHDRWSHDNKRKPRKICVHRSRSDNRQFSARLREVFLRYAVPSTVPGQPGSRSKDILKRKEKAIAPSLLTVAESNGFSRTRILRSCRIVRNNTLRFGNKMHPKITIRNAKPLNHWVRIVNVLTFAIVAIRFVEVIAPPVPFTKRVVN